MALSSFRDLRVWQGGMDLVEAIYKLTKGFPGHELYGLTSQMQRAVVSVPSNIAEGYTRQHRREYLQHLAIARASLAELDTQLEISSRLNYASNQQCEIIREDIDALNRQLYALRQSLSAGTREKWEAG